MGVGLVVAIAALTSGLEDAQGEILNPLGSIGTDLSVTRPVVATTQDAQAGQGGQGGPGGFGLGAGPSDGIFIGERPGGGGAGGLSGEDQAALIAENQSVITDLSKLGESGDQFVHDYFLPADQLTFPEDDLAQVEQVEGVAYVAKGLTLLAVHQEGTVPEIVAEIETGGEEMEIVRDFSPPTEAERSQMRECFQRGQQHGSSGDFSVGGCVPQRLLSFRETITTPRRTIREALNPPETDIQSDPYVIAGVDTTNSEIGLVTESQVAEGKYFGRDEDETKDAILAASYASRKGLDIGSTIDLNGTIFEVVGLAQPPVGGQAADVYLPLTDLQELSNREGRANILLVRADDSSVVEEVSANIESTVTGASVTSAADLAGRISGSLVDASKLSDRLGAVLQVIGLAFVFIMGSLLTLSSIAKRVRELGTLKAIGWGQGLVVRQVVLESLVLALIGGIIGVAIGAGVAYGVAAYTPPLEVTAASVGSPAGSFFGLGDVGTEEVSATVDIVAPLDFNIMIMAIGLALLGGLIAGAIGALRAARLRPADALRNLG